MDHTPPKRDLFPPIALFFKRAKLAAQWRIHCLKCGLPFTQTNMELTMGADNPGSDGDEAYTQTMCKRCKQQYRLHSL